jgi:nitrite reductase (NADH) large subunit
MMRAPATTIPIAAADAHARQKLVVIGNGMAGAKTLEHLLEIAPDKYDITVFGAETQPNYNRILLSPVLAGEMTLSDIIINDRAWYHEHGITLHLGKSVTGIDRHRRVVTTADGTSAPYDRLLLATGSQPVRLPLPGNTLQGVLTYRDIDDTEAMIARCQSASHAVVIGGGLLGLEAANGLAARGLSVTVVHVMPWVMERQLDRDAAHTLQRALETRGIAFRLAAKTTAILGEDHHVCGVQIEGGETLPADLVVMSVGIRPNVRLAEACGLHVSRGIVVDDTMQTYDPRIYAVGECVAHRGTSYGLVAPLYDMAKVCATHLAAVGSHYYQGSIAATRLKVTGVDVFSAGNFMGTTNSEEMVVEDAASGVYRKLVIENDRLIGSVLVGDSTAASTYMDMIADRRSVAALRGELMFLQ